MTLGGGWEWEILELMGWSKKEVKSGKGWILTKGKIEGEIEIRLGWIWGHGKFELRVNFRVDKIEGKG